MDAFGVAVADAADVASAAAVEGPVVVGVVVAAAGDVVGAAAEVIVEVVLVSL